MCDSVSGEGSRWRMKQIEFERMPENGLAPSAQRCAKCCRNGGERPGWKPISLISSILRGASVTGGLTVTNDERARPYTPT